ncbi:MAG TPA: hypothetical protein VGI95_21915 [Caulobacteraceae bacterium]|jgi:hypothetical protein
MRAKDKVRVLGEVLGVRRTQRSAAEMALAEALAKLQRLSDRRDDQARLLTGLQASWSQSMNGGSVQLQLARAWQAEIVTEEATLILLGLEVDAATRAQELARDTLTTAIGCFDAARSLVRSAQRRAARTREEAMLAEADDRSARQGVRT